MNGSCRRERKTRHVCDGSKKITGKKWELPLPKPRGYWEKFIEDEERRLIIVRNPFLTFPQNKPNNSDSRRNSSLNSLTDDRKFVHDSSLKSFLRGSKFSSNRDRRREGTSSFTKSTISFRATAKIPDARSKVPRIPKLGPWPRFGEMNDTRAGFAVRNEPGAQYESPSTLPVLGSRSKPLDPRSMLRNLQERLRMLKKTNFPRLTDRSRSEIISVKGKRTGVNQSKADEIADETRRTLTDEDFLKYSSRISHRALKRVTKSKNLDFKPKTVHHLGQTTDFSLSNDGKPGLSTEEDTEKREQGEESLHVSDFQRISEKRSPRCSEFSPVDEETASRTISTGSRSTSGPSFQFGYPENREHPSDRVLSSIPKMCIFPRRNRDRCLCCLYKSFEAPLEAKVSLPGTTLQRIMAPGSTLVASFKDSSEDSDSSHSLEREAEKILSTKAMFQEELDVSDGETATDAVSCFHENLPETISEQNDVPKSESTHEKVLADQANENRQNDGTLSTNLNDPAAVSVPVSCTEEESKVSSSIPSENSEEDESIVVSIGEDQPKSKYLVPCHAPTNFRPSLEPLRALRSRKPTTLQDRIAFLEASSSRNSSSAGDYEDVPEKSRSTSKGISKEDKSKRNKSAPPPLTKAKSVLEKLTATNGDQKEERQRHALRKGTSFSSFPVSTDITSNKPETRPDASRESNATAADGFSKTRLATDFSRSKSGLPLTSAKEVVEALGDLPENTSPTSMLEILSKEFAERLLSGAEDGDSSARERNRVIATLTRLLVDSKRYLCPDKFPSDLRFSTNQPPPCNSRLLKRIFPRETYNLIAPLLGMPEEYPKRSSSDPEGEKKFESERVRFATEYAKKEDSVKVHPPTLKGTESLDEERIVGHHRYNPYGLFLTRPRRKVITWRPLTEHDLEGYDPDATLRKRAENSMKRICQDFCQWVETLGQTESTIDEQMLQDMFEIDFSAEACRAMQVLIREMPVVPVEVAITRNNPGASKLAMTKKHVMQDVKAEKSPPKAIAFGRSLPWDIRFIPPKNEVEKNWLGHENVPKDVETMDVVWKDIVHLRSVRGFVVWLQNHPEVPLPLPLRKIALMNARLLRQVEDDETFAHLELDLHQIQTLRVEVDDNDMPRI